MPAGPVDVAELAIGCGPVAVLAVDVWLLAVNVVDCSYLAHVVPRITNSKNNTQNEIKNNLPNTRRSSHKKKPK